MQNYEVLIEKISKLSGLAKEELERRVEAKRAKLSGLISKEGAAQIIAAELNINFESMPMKINELVGGMKRINVAGKIITLFPVREYNKNNRQGKVANLIIADETGNTKVVLWDTNHISLIETKTLNEGDVIEIANATTRENEIHLSGFSDIKKSMLVIENVKAEKSLQEKEIHDLQQGQNILVRGVVVQLFNPKFFNVCSICNKKLTEAPDGFTCTEHGKVNPRERAILTFVLDDGTETIKVVLFSEQINKLLAEADLKDSGKLLIFRDKFLGSEMHVSGNVKKNTMFNNLEINGSDVFAVDVEKLIEKLEKN